jgi:ankyrin repeat protein
LINAADKGHTETVNSLIKAGADLNLKDNKGRTALMFASRI